MHRPAIRAGPHEMAAMPAGLNRGVEMLLNSRQMPGKQAPAAAPAPHASMVEVEYAELRKAAQPVPNSDMAEPLALPDMLSGFMWEDDECDSSDMGWDMAEPLALPDMLSGFMWED